MLIQLFATNTLFIVCLATISRLLRSKSDYLISFVVSSSTATVVLGLVSSLDRVHQSLLTFLIWIAEVPLLFMWWSTLKSGATVSLIRNLGGFSEPVCLDDWYQASIFGNEMRQQFAKRLAILQRIGLIRWSDTDAVLTIRGKVVLTILKIWR